MSVETLSDARWQLPRVSEQLHERRGELLMRKLGVSVTNPGLGHSRALIRIVSQPRYLRHQRFAIVLSEH